MFISCIKITQSTMNAPSNPASLPNATRMNGEKTQKKKKKKRNHSACRFWLNSDTPLMQETNCLEATSSFEPR